MAKGGVNRYKVDIQGLSNGTHQFEFDIDPQFFERFENSPVNNGSLNCRLQLDNSERLIDSLVEIEGKVELECDRSLELFDYPIHLEKEVIFKYGAEYEELDENVIQIPKTADHIDFSELIYEFIVLEVPMKKVHPKYKEDETDDDTMVYTTGNEESQEDKEDNQETDPRWSALKNLSKKK